MLHIPVRISLSEPTFFFSYCPGEAIILAFQHYILALGTAVMIPAVLVPMMGGDDVSSCTISDQFRVGSWQRQFGDV